MVVFNNKKIKDHQQVSYKVESIKNDFIKYEKFYLKIIRKDPNHILIF